MPYVAITSIWAIEGCNKSDRLRNYPFGEVGFSRSWLMAAYRRFPSVEMVVFSSVTLISGCVSLLDPDPEQPTIITSTAINKKRS
jgi:hypothetical protein